MSRPTTTVPSADARSRPTDGFDATAAVAILAFAACAWLGIKASFFFNWNQEAQDAMLLLALLLLLRCALDPWDVLYYPMPCLIALLAWEMTTFDRLPRISLVATVITWLLFLEAQQSFGLNLNTVAAVFIAVAMPAICAIGARLLAATPDRTLAANGESGYIPAVGAKWR